MKRIRILVTLVVPSVIAGGLVFGNRPGHAAAGNDDNLWPAAADRVVAQRDPRPTPPRDRWGSPPAPPAPPTPPIPPKRAGKHSISVSIHGDRVQINGIQELVGEHLDAVREMLRTNPNIPKDVRDRIVARMDRVKAIVDNRLKNVRTTDIDKLGDEMEKMGEELEKALDGLDGELAQLGDKVGKDVAKQVAKGLTKGKLKLKYNGADTVIDDNDNDTDTDNDGDHDNDGDDGDSASADTDDIPVAIDDIKDFTLKPAQRDAIARLNNQSTAAVAQAEKQLDDASRQLETALGNPSISDAEVVRLVDQVSGVEAAIRKAKLLAWVQARRVLDSDQVRKLEALVHRPRGHK